MRVRRAGLTMIRRDVAVVVDRELMTILVDVRRRVRVVGNADERTPSDRILRVHID